jgi:hypothetical protein
VERRRTWGQPGPRNAQAIECRHVQDVEAASPVHQHLVDPLGPEQRSHHERVAFWLRHVVGVVCMVEGDRTLRPHQVQWLRGLGVVDPASDQLLLASRGSCRCLAKDPALRPPCVGPTLVGYGNYSCERVVGGDARSGQRRGRKLPCEVERCRARRLLVKNEVSYR